MVTKLSCTKQLHVCERILEVEGVHGYVTVDEYPLDFITLDNDVISLEMPQFFRSFFLVSITVKLKLLPIFQMLFKD